MWNLFGICLQWHAGRSGGQSSMLNVQPSFGVSPVLWVSHESLIGNELGWYLGETETHWRFLKKKLLKVWRQIPEDNEPFFPFCCRVCLVHSSAPLPNHRASRGHRSNRGGVCVWMMETWAHKSACSGDSEAATRGRVQPGPHRRAVVDTKDPRLRATQPCNLHLGKTCSRCDAG